MPPAAPRKAQLLRAFVLLLAIGEVSTAVYLWYALFFDDTTSWIGLMLEGTSDLWQTVVVPFGVAGTSALAFGFANRLLWVALALLLAAPAVSAAMLLA